MHQHFWHVSSNTIHQLQDKQTKCILTAKWTINCGDAFSTLEITRTVNAPKERYSLYTLGLQGRIHDVDITVLSTAANVKFTDHAGAPVGVGSSGTIMKTGVLGHGSHKPDPNGIVFVEFDGLRCEIRAVSGRHLHSERLLCPEAHSSGHEYVPPPPESGGEN